MVGIFPRCKFFQQENLQSQILQMYNTQMSNVDPQTSKDNTLTTSELKKILLDHKDWLKTAGRDGKPANLKDYHLKGVVLLGADLSNADLEGAYLYGAYLKNANLENSNLQGANLRGANLRWANLKNADLKKANLTRADLMQAEIKNARLEGANLKMVEGLTSEQLAEAHTDSKTTF